MKKSDLDFQLDRVTVTIPQTKTYNPRIFVITDNAWIIILKQYLDLRAKVENERFFLQFRYGKVTKQPFGHNSISQFPNKIAGFLKLNNVRSYTGHCFRRTAATLFANNGGNSLQLKRLGGWKSSTIAEGYVDNSVAGQLQIANVLTSVPDAVEGASSIQVQRLESESMRSENNSVQKFNFQNKHGLSVTINSSDHANVTINFNN